MQLRLELLNEGAVDRFGISPTKSSFIFTNLDKAIEQVV